jgi:geranylgeranyl pyrophosphate synthase/predicted secreted hydrolase
MQLRDSGTLALCDESPRWDARMEWWFVQGHYQGPGSGRREFMTVLVRSQSRYSGAPLDTFSLLLSILDPATGRAEVRSQVDPGTCEFLVREIGPAPPPGFDPVITRAVADEVAECGPPRPIRCVPDPVYLTTAPLRAAWDGFEFRQQETIFELRFSEPETGRKCRFGLRPLRPRVHLADIEVTGSDSMDYASYTRLAMEGEVDGEAVRGQAWLDHQWGTRGWFLASGGEHQVLGWDWLGIQLEDGHDLLVMVHREQRRNQVLSRYAILVEPSGQARLVRDFNLTPGECWTSPATRTRYPVVWDLAIPELGLDLRFTPCIENQEIPMLPPLRAIWEGAGRVSGSWAGRPVSGDARLEMHGYAYLLDVPEHLESVVQSINGHIERYFPRTLRQADMERYAGPASGQYDPGAQTEVLSRPLWDLLDRGGKHWRPIFAFLTLEALGVSRQPYEQLLSLMVELPHGGSLVIDDIEDNALVRRGQECIHLRYGLDVAINAGNTAYFLPLALLADYPHLSEEQRLALYRVLSRAYVRSHLGQGQDIYWSKYLNVERLNEWMGDLLGPKILELYTQKTASVVEGAAEIVCILARSGEATREACVEFGRALGIAFQIVDDILDFSPARIARGQGGCDLREGKLSYVIFRALQELAGPERERLGGILCCPELRRDPAVHAQGLALVRGSGVLRTCRDEALALVKPAWKSLSWRLPPSEPKTVLRVLWSFLLSLGDDERHVEFTPGN